MITHEYLAIMSCYNTRMNARIYELCATIPDLDRKADRGAFFKSIHGILNHLLLTDRLWMSRFTGVPFAVESLSQELYSDFDELRAQRQLTDAAIAEWTAKLTDEQLAAPFTFTSISKPVPRTMPLALTLTHVFNHQTHHRGQLTTLLDQLGYDYGVTDLPVILQLPEPSASNSQGT